MVPSLTASNITVAFDAEFNVTVNLLPASTSSDIVAVMFTVSFRPYAPSELEELKEETVGFVVSL